MIIKHTHPDYTEEEREEKLRSIKKNCRQLLTPKERQEDAP